MLPRMLLIIFFVLSLGVSLGGYPHEEKSGIGAVIAVIIFMNFLLWLGGWYDGFVGMGLFK